MTAVKTIVPICKEIEGFVTNTGASAKRPGLDLALTNMSTIAEQVYNCAIDQSEYITLSLPGKQISGHIDACAADYKHNVACHPVNAFTATRSLKSSILGKVFH
jgi:hypothetical protein